MRFSRLCAEAGLAESDRSGDAEVRRVVVDSRRAQDGDCFVAVRGAAADGHRFVPEAVAAGCTAVVCEDAAAVPPGPARAVAGDTRAAVGPLAQAILGWPARKLTVVGVTGTNGKTTSTYLLRQILRAAGHKVALTGTVAYDTLAEATAAVNTTPGPVQLADMMAQMLGAGATHLVMEVSSHALDQRRTDGIALDVGVFTNLSGDHLDYHGSMQAYLAAKRRLFESLPPAKTAVVNRDDPYGRRMLPPDRGDLRVIWYGLSPAADVWARIEEITAAGSRFVLGCAGREAAVRSPLVGRHNVYNCLAAAAAAVAMGKEIDTAARAIEQVEVVPGRLQRVCAAGDIDVLVDYAHTDDALKNVLAALAPINRGRLILVFGCGGDRDRTKRPRMARVAEEFADRIFVTSDNPRSEDPEAIIREIMAGFSRRGRGKVHPECDRGRAIAAAIAAAAPGDTVLVAGKGHEDYQIIGDRRIHFDDVEAAAQILRHRQAKA